jgi:predicted double-glycine peptidase
MPGEFDLKVLHYRQSRPWSCGPACVRIILSLYGIEEAERDLIDEMGASALTGTAPRAIERALGGRGIGFAKVTNFHRLRTAKRPAIVAYQDHGPRGTDYATSWDHGHYAVIIAASRDRVTLSDPSSKRPRRHLNTADFLSRWHDIDAAGTVYRQWGLLIDTR